MKITNNQMVNSIPNLKTLSQKQLPIQVSYKIAKNIRNIEQELVIYERERQKLVDRYAEKDTEGKPKVNDNGNYVIKDKLNWNKDILELLNFETDVEIEKIDIKELDGVEISPGELMTIDYMIK